MTNLPEIYRDAIIIGDERPCLTLWLEDIEKSESVGFFHPVSMDWDRYQVDERYSAIVADHIRRSLAHLAEEIRSIGIMTPTWKWVNGEQQEVLLADCWCRDLDYLVHISEHQHERK